MRYVLSRVLAALLFGAVLFASARRLDWPGAWLYLAVVLLGEITSGAVLQALDPEVLRARARLWRPDTRRFERVILPLWLVVGYAAGVVAGLDARRPGWSPLPSGWTWPGLVLMASGYALATWAMAVNAFFELTVRIQTDRGQRVITSGPYRIVRHPGYLAALLGAVAAPLLVGSAWMFAPTSVLVALFAIRTALEDRTLQRELPGYRAYAERTRWRLVPGVW